ncbi:MULTISPECIES: AraC family transcriptional regulator [unclassified Facklamia]|uniref:AraC family transcriptional regulator n=1 Tax=Aerococcaceae TaxID=186827 RepID=UPI0013B9B858|nr:MULTISPECIES: AraC family transcriptional regulator [unclassified Facklamia]NEW65100.1 AraC family transcriptional regulator [Facklamia sp. 252]NEW68704.1 AraC family transcriptional regulator [Facklamia sp. 253]QQD65497.1 helix-turn-helix transcriptional regulator [Aerococcaceae bacterium zg-252]
MVENLTYFKKTLQTLKIPYHHYSLQMENIETIDNGFRKHYLNSKGYERFVVILQRFIKPTELVRITDNHDLTYYLFYYLTENDSYITIGPLLTNYTENNKKTLLYKEFYDNQIIFKDLNHLDYLLVSLINTFSERDIRLKVLPNKYLEEPKAHQHLSQYSDTIEDYYALENKILLAITNANAEEAIFLKDYQATLSFNSRSNDPLSEKKLRYSTFNTLCRKAVEKNHIPPFYIDKLSSQIANTIIRETSIDRLADYDHTIIYFYCDLVQRYRTISQYAPLIQKALMYIEEHYQTDISLYKLAEHCHISKNYLSALFHREVKQSLSDYLQQFRIEKSCELLANKNLTIAEISEKCGFQSSDYFSKVFKRIKQETPTQYRLKL